MWICSGWTTHNYGRWWWFMLKSGIVARLNLFTTSFETKTWTRPLTIGLHSSHSMSFTRLWWLDLMFQPCPILLGRTCSYKDPLHFNSPASDFAPPPSSRFHWHPPRGSFAAAAAQHTNLQRRRVFKRCVPFFWMYLNHVSAVSVYVYKHTDFMFLILCVSQRLHAAPKLWFAADVCEWRSPLKGQMFGLWCKDLPTNKYIHVSTYSIYHISYIMYTQYPKSIKNNRMYSNTS